MRLRELEPEFLRREVRPCAGPKADGSACEHLTLSPHTEHTFHVHVASIDEADGIFFLCPVCFAANRGPQGTHGVICWRPRVPAGIDPGPGRWEFLGTGLDDLTLSAGSSSILLQGGCNAHFFVENGAIRF